STRRPANTNPQFATSNVILPTAGNAPRPQGFIPFNSFNQSAQKFLKTQQQINTGMKDFGDQAFLAGRRFLAFTAATSSIFAFSFALQRALADSVQFEREMIRVAQVTGTSIDATRSFGRQIRQLSIDLGISGTELSNVAVTLAQAGFKDNDLQAALNTIAKTDLTATFESLEQTTEGLIAAKNQFKLLAQDYEG